MTCLSKCPRRTFALLFIAAGGILCGGCQETRPIDPVQSQPALEREYPEPDSGNLRAFVELARKDVQLQKATIIAENLPLTEGEAAEFWPLHREYEGELIGLNDRKLAMIEDYLARQGSMSEEQARELARDAFDLEEKRTDLKRKYFRKFQEAIPAVKAARFFQIENQLNMVLDLRVAAALPLIK
jgi:polyhydroxyalkanoate synthesis regulator phasin